MKEFLADLFLTEDARKKRFVQLLQAKQYKEAEEVLHRLNRGTFIGDFVYGANDGIITTFAVVAGAAGAALSPGVIIILGIANLVADGFSMGASNFLSLRSKREFVKTQRKKAEWEVEQFPENEKDEVRDILRSWGIPESVLEQSVYGLTQNKKKWVDLMMKEELGLQEEEDANPSKHGTATFLAFLAAGSIPLVPYFIGNNSGIQFLFSSIFAGLAFFAVGSARTLVTHEHPFRGGLEIMLVGGFAAAVAYAIGWAVKTVLGITI
ncbi:MAG: VIT1/CCC1 transporter family protein [Candidatus Wildermuthbacteria bacterium]|nr:VIT1/CCC1 transporter family protein [Candidatus Wildermuthbacteria bacterium]